MFSLPEWAPSVHPLIVHFPIALLFIAVLADFLSLVSNKQVWLHRAASGLYALGALSALVSLFTGRDAAESVFLAASANALLTDHANWAEWTVWFYGVYALARLVVEWRQLDKFKAVQMLFFFVGAAGLLLVKETGEHGAQLVYQHGVGVASYTIDYQPQEAESGTSELTGQNNSGDGHHMDAQATGEGHQHDQGGEVPVQAKGGEHKHTTDSHDQMFQEPVVEKPVAQKEWKWDVGHDGVTEFKQRFQMVAGDWEGMQIVVDHDSSEGDVLTLQMNDISGLFVSGPPVGSMQYDLRLNMAAFTGVVRLVHHVLDVDNYNFMEVDDKQIRLGRIAGGTIRVEDRGSASADGWIDLRVVSDGTHFRGYVNKKMVVHGHGTEPAPGPVGLYVQGTGVVKFDGFGVEVLR